MRKFFKDEFKVVKCITITLIVICVVLILLSTLYACDILMPTQTHIDITDYPTTIDYGILSEQQIETFDSILEAVNNGESVINCPIYSDKEWHEIITQLGMYFGTLSTDHLTFRDDNSVYLDLNRFKEVLNEKIIIDARIDEAVSTLREGSDRYKLWQISNYISAKIEYTKGHRKTITALNGKSVCTGYSMLFYKMATRLGIKTYVCYGCIDKTCHSWNMVELNGEYRYYDITWYDGVFHRIAYIHSKSSAIENFQINNKWTNDLNKSNNNIKIGFNKRIKMSVRELKAKMIINEMCDCMIIDYYAEEN